MDDVTRRFSGDHKTVPRAYGVLAMLFIFQTLNFFDKLAFGISAVPMMHDLRPRYRRHIRP